MADKIEDSVIEIEIEIAKNLLKKGYGWIARDVDDDVYAYGAKPVKGGKAWWQGDASLLLMDGNARGVIPIFDGIRWEDEEPVRLRDVVPQILTDDEREWLRVVTRPFRDRLKYAKAYDGLYYGRYVLFCVAPPEKWKDHPDECNLIQLSRDSFAGMEDGKKYTPEELGI